MYNVHSTIVESLFCFQSLSQYERLAQTTGDQYENVTIPTTKIPPKIQEKTRKNSSNLPPMPVRNQAEVSYATLELNPIENPTHGMFIRCSRVMAKNIAYAKFRKSLLI